MTDRFLSWEVRRTTAREGEATSEARQARSGEGLGKRGRGGAGEIRVSRAAKKSKTIQVTSQQVHGDIFSVIN